ncbi:MAG: hypothetical protein LBQ73_07920 [Tannerellaceae bacterium]|jgi:hypothetical protein|nr:hypothetical protein [Tannerellaceae bacterium]
MDVYHDRQGTDEVIWMGKSVNMQGKFFMNDLPVLLMKILIGSAYK